MRFIAAGTCFRSLLKQYENQKFNQLAEKSVRDGSTDGQWPVSLGLTRLCDARHDAHVDAYINRVLPSIPGYRERPHRERNHIHRPPKHAISGWVARANEGGMLHAGRDIQIGLEHVFRYPVSRLPRHEAMRRAKHFLPSNALPP